MTDDEDNKVQRELEAALGHKWNDPVCHWILDARGEPVPATGFLDWARWLENRDNRVVKQEQIGSARVSTLFLGLDFSFGGPPILWETMVFSVDKTLNDQRRCGGNREQAEAMHAQVCAEVTAKLAAHG